MSTIDISEKSASKTKEKFKTHVETIGYVNKSACNSVEKSTSNVEKSTSNGEKSTSNGEKSTSNNVEKSTSNMEKSTCNNVEKTTSNNVEKCTCYVDESTCNVKKSFPVTGHECQFVDQPPNRWECPICLLALRQPHQVTCCGKVFCKACICELRDKEKPCPACKCGSFACYLDKGLQQELYGIRVYCPKKTEGCDWVGELGELDQHLHPEEREMDGCGFVYVNCLYCQGSCQRCEIDHHRSTECVKRPLTCELCQEYKSTYNDVVFFHLAICKCRPVECPNQCGDVVKHQELEEHLSHHCELSEVECEFGHAGCEAKMLRKDMSSHLSDNMVSHISLLAVENSRLKSELENELRDVKKRVENLEVEKILMNSFYSRLPPFHIQYPWKKHARWSGPVCHLVDFNEWFSEPFYSHIGGYKLRLKVWCSVQNKTWIKSICLSYELIDNTYQVDSSFTMFITTSIFDLENGKSHIQKMVKITDSSSDSLTIQGFLVMKCFKKGNDNMEICVERIEVLNNSPACCSVDAAQ